MSTTEPATKRISFEDAPAADATGATVTVSNTGIRITFPNGDAKYYYGVGAVAAASCTVNFGKVPELEGENAPVPSAKLLAKYGGKPVHLGVCAVGQLTKIQVGRGRAAVGAVGCLESTGAVFNFGRSSQ